MGLFMEESARAGRASMRQKGANCVSDGVSQVALREWRAEFSRPATLPALVGVGILLTILAPFETGALLRPLPRFAYWLVLAGLTYSVGIVVSAMVARVVRRLSRWPRLALQALAVGAAVSVVVLGLNAAVFGYWPGPRALLLSIGNVMGIAAVITYLLSLPTETAAADPTPPPLLDRLPLDKRGPILALTVEDHYTRVRTTKGTHLVLMRLGDAIREVGETPGARVHRSHWAAWGQVTAARREGDRAILTLTDGAEVPVSRANLAKVRDAGLLAR